MRSENAAKCVEVMSRAGFAYCAESSLRPGCKFYTLKEPLESDVAVVADCTAALGAAGVVMTPSKVGTAPIGSGEVRSGHNSAGTSLGQRRGGRGDRVVARTIWVQVQFSPDVAGFCTLHFTRI